MPLTKKITEKKRREIESFLNAEKPLTQPKIAKITKVSKSTVTRVKAAMKPLSTRPSPKPRKVKGIVSKAPKGAPPRQRTVQTDEPGVVLVRVQTALSFYKPETLVELREELQSGVDRNVNVTLNPMRAWACLLALGAVQTKAPYRPGEENERMGSGA
jgi:transposase